MVDRPSTNVSQALQLSNLRGDVQAGHARLSTMNRMSLKFIISPTDPAPIEDTQKAAKTLYGMLWNEGQYSPTTSHSTNTGPPSPISDNGSLMSRSPRYQYDEEQAAYLLYLYYFYLKVEPRACWDKVSKLFEMRFPPGGQRRQQGRGLSRSYERRQINGLNSKFYRLRDAYLPDEGDFETKRAMTAHLVRPYNFPSIPTLVQWASQM